MSIQSEVVRGHVGNSAARFALQRTGFDVWALPTVILSNHPGHGQTRGETVDAHKIASLYEGLRLHHWDAQVSAVLSGYLGHPDQASTAAKIVREIKAANPKSLYLCDPVFGDDEGAYAKLGVAEAMARELIPLADIVAPNRFELSSLTSQRIDSPGDAVRAARLLSVTEVLVSSVPDNGKIANVVVNPQGAWSCSVERLEDVPHGTGDLLSALYLGARLRGEPAPHALLSSISQVQAIVSASAGMDELALIPAQALLVSPPSGFAVHGVS
ncbi:MAG: pyridoxal kinase [Micropepsaceae bacterium]